MTHPPDIDLLDLVEGKADDTGLIKAHVAGCRDCKAKMVSIVGHYMDVLMLDDLGHDPLG